MGKTGRVLQYKNPGEVHGACGHTLALSPLTPWNPRRSSVRRERGEQRELSRLKGTEGVSTVVFREGWVNERWAVMLKWEEGK